MAEVDQTLDEVSKDAQTANMDRMKAGYEAPGVGTKARSWFGNKASAAASELKNELSDAKETIKQATSKSDFVGTFRESANDAREYGKVGQVTGAAIDKIADGLENMTVGKAAKIGVAVAAVATVGAPAALCAYAAYKACKWLSGGKSSGAEQAQEKVEYVAAKRSGDVEANIAKAQAKMDAKNTKNLFGKTKASVVGYDNGKQEVRFNVNDLEGKDAKRVNTALEKYTKKNPGVEMSSKDGEITVTLPSATYANHLLEKVGLGKTADDGASFKARNVRDTRADFEVVTESVEPTIKPTADLPPIPLAGAPAPAPTKPAFEVVEDPPLDMNGLEATTEKVMSKDSRELTKLTIEVGKLSLDDQLRVMKALEDNGVKKGSYTIDSELTKITTSSASEKDINKLVSKLGMKVSDLAAERASDVEKAYAEFDRENPGHQLNKADLLKQTQELMKKQGLEKQNEGQETKLSFGDKVKITMEAMAKTMASGNPEFANSVGDYIKDIEKGNRPNPKASEAEQKSFAPKDGNKERFNINDIPLGEAVKLGAETSNRTMDGKDGPSATIVKAKGERIVAVDGASGQPIGVSERGKPTGPLQPIEQEGANKNSVETSVNKDGKIEANKDNFKFMSGKNNPEVRIESDVKGVKTDDFKAKSSAAPTLAPKQDRSESRPKVFSDAMPRAGLESPKPGRNSALAPAEGVGAAIGMLTAGGSPPEKVSERGGPALVNAEGKGTRER